MKAAVANALPLALMLAGFVPYWVSAPFMWLYAPFFHGEAGLAVLVYGPLTGLQPGKRAATRLTGGRLFPMQG